MSRRPRLFIPEASYHVYCRVARGERVFDNPHESESFIEAKTRELYRCPGAVQVPGETKLTK